MAANDWPLGPSMVAIGNPPLPQIVPMDNLVELLAHIIHSIVDDLILNLKHRLYKPLCAPCDEGSGYETRC